MELVPIFAITGFFGSIITFIYMRYKSRHAERMALIESGQSADILTEENFSNGESGLKNGLFLIGGGLGFLIGKVLESALRWEEASGIIPMTIVGAGLGLVLFYIIMQNKRG